MLDTFSKVPINITTPSILLRIPNTSESIEFPFLVISVLCNLWHIVMNICKNPEDGLNFLEMHLLESTSLDGTVQVTEVIHLEYIKPLSPFVVFDIDAELKDAFDFAPTRALFSTEYFLKFKNGYTKLYADCSAFGIEISEHIDQTSRLKIRREQ